MNKLTLSLALIVLPVYGQTPLGSRLTTVASYASDAAANAACTGGSCAIGKLFYCTGCVPVGLRVATSAGTFEAVASGAGGTLTDGDKGDIVVSSSGSVFSIDTGVVLDADINGSAAITATKIADGTVTSAEFQYINTLTSNAQAQLDAKAPLASPVLTGIVTLPSAATPTTDAAGEVAVDLAAWGAGRDALEFFDGTASTYIIGALASDTPSNGQVPKWNTGGTITWEDDADSPASGISNVSEDTTPQLGGNLDPQSFTVGAATAADLTKLNALTSTAIELNYTDGVTSAIQTQIDAKQASDAALTAIAAGSDFVQFTGPASSTKVFTLPDATATILTTNADVTVAQGGTGIASGTSGGVPYFSGSTTIASSAALTANLPVIGGGAGVAPSVGTRSGNTTAYVTTTGTQTSGRCVEIDASGNHIAASGACSAGTTDMTQSTANDTDNTVSVSVGTSGRAFEKTTVTIDPSTGNVLIPGTLALGAGTIPWNMTGYTDDAAPSAPGTANQFTSFVDRTSGLMAFILNGGSVKYLAETASPTFTGIVTLPSAASPTTDAVGELAIDLAAWASGRDAIEYFDGTASTYILGALASDTPTNGQVPKWNTGGTITWEADSTSGTAVGWLNVKDPAYGAVGDGSNDDSAEIQSAITAAAALISGGAPGATVLFPPGDYNLGTTGLTSAAGVNHLSLHFVDGAKLTYSGTGAALAVGSASAVTTHFTLSGRPRIDLASGAGTSSIGFLINRAFWWRADNLMVETVSKGGACTGTARVAIKSDGTTTTNWSGYGVVINPFVAGDFKHGLLFTQSAGMIDGNNSNVVIGGSVGNTCSDNPTGFIGQWYDVGDNNVILNTDHDSWTIGVQFDGHANRANIRTENNTTADWRVETGAVGNQIYGGWLTKDDDGTSTMFQSGANGGENLTQLNPLTVNGNTKIGNGTLSFSSTAAAAADVTITRVGAKTILSDSEIISARGFGESAIGSRVTGEAGYRFTTSGGGTLFWGDGTNPVDTDLYRNANSVLRTTDSLIIDTNLTVSGTSILGTVNTETAGNTMTIPSFINLPVAVCSNATTAAPSMNMPTSNAPAAACELESNGRLRPYLAFDSATVETVQYGFPLPPGFTGNVDLTVWWSTPATSGNAIFQIETACVAAGEDENVAFNTLQSFAADAADAQADDDNTATQTSITMTGCAADEMFRFRFGRDADNASDTINAADVHVHNLRFTIRNAY